jgi:predicted dehydrogenase
MNQRTVVGPGWISVPLAMSKDVAQRSNAAANWNKRRRSYTVARNQIRSVGLLLDNPGSQAHGTTGNRTGTNMGKLRIGVIGLGSISTYHLQAIEALAERVALTVVCCRTESTGSAAAAKYDCRWVADYRQSFEHVDALIIATPHDLHYAMVKDALEAGVRNILLEKPIANRREQIDELIDLAESKQAVVQVGYELRYEPALQAMKQVIDQRRFGRPVMALLRTEHGFAPDEFQALMPWAGTIETLGGGVLFSHGCHYVDLLIWMLGDVVKADAVRNRTLLKGVMEGEDSAILNLEFAGGAIASYMATWAVRWRELSIDFRIYCEDGQVVFQQLEDASTKLYAIAAQGREDLVVDELATVTGPTDGFVTCATFERQLAAFLDNVSRADGGGGQLKEGRKSVDAIWQAYRSSAASELTEA